MRSQVEHPDFPDGVAIIGSDQDASRFVMSYFDERGVSRLMEVEAAGHQITWRHDGANLRQTLTLTAKAGETVISQGRMSMNGGPWGTTYPKSFGGTTTKRRAVVE